MGGTLTASFYFIFLGPHLWYMEVSSLGVKSELQLPACTTATAIRDASHVCDLYHSSEQRQGLNPHPHEYQSGSLPVSHEGNSHYASFIYLFSLFRAAPTAYRGRGLIGTVAAGYLHRSSLQRQIPSPLSEPATSWFLVGFVSGVPQWELHNSYFLMLPLISHCEINIWGDRKIVVPQYVQDGFIRYIPSALDLAQEFNILAQRCLECWFLFFFFQTVKSQSLRRCLKNIKHQMKTEGVIVMLQKLDSCPESVLFSPPALLFSAIVMNFIERLDIELVLSLLCLFWFSSVSFW